MRKEFNMQTWKEFKDGREDGSITCPSRCPHRDKAGCPIMPHSGLCWNSYIRWAGEETE